MKNIFCLRFRLWNFHYTKTCHIKEWKGSLRKRFFIEFRFIVWSILWYLGKMYVYLCHISVQIHRHIDLKLYVHKIVYLSDKLNLALIAHKWHWCQEGWWYGCYVIWVYGGISGNAHYLDSPYDKNINFSR